MERFTFFGAALVRARRPLTTAFWLGCLAWLCLTPSGLVRAASGTAPLAAKTVTVCIESRSLPASAVHKTLSAVSAGVRTLIRPGDKGTVIYIRDATYSPEGGLQTIIVPGIDPIPKPCPNPFDVACKRKIEAAMQLVQNQLHSAGMKVENELSRLAALDVPSGAGAPNSLGGCLFKAQELLGKRTVRYLIVAGTFGALPPQNGQLLLNNVDLDVVYACDKSYVTCRHQRAVWGTYFTDAHVIDQAWWDPQQPIPLLGKT